MRTADAPVQDSDPINFYFPADNSSHQFYFYFHFADFSPTVRGLRIQINGLDFTSYYRLWYLTMGSSYSPSPWSGYNKYNVSINKAENSTLPPIINALEVYTVRQFLTSETGEKNVDALLRIKSIYAIRRNWQGDPCSPQAFVWDGVKCSYIDHDSPRIISLNLSTSGLSGIIAPCISNFSDIQSLDLSHNRLTGEVPQFLSALTSLKTLNLQGNNFTGSVPAPLLEKSKQGLLSLRIDSLENLCQSGACNGEKKKKKDKVTILVIASVLTASFVLLAAFITRWMIKRRKQEEFNKLDAKSNKNQGLLDKKDRHFTYSEILSITNNFQRVVGKGGFGTVYYGCLGDTQVAVKMLSPSSFQGYNQFHAEANLLVNVHHRSLTSLVGYCIDGNNMGIIYEYMANGNLEWHISDRNLSVLSWERRLRIARDAAQGLEYLHRGCKPPIIHRDVKCSNILLNEEFQAKLGDFGLSRVFPAETGDHISTIAAGTPGYLDPEYYASNRLTEKSDVYSFGIVLLKIITSRPAIAKNDDKTHIAHWINSRLQEGDIKNIVDPRLGGDFDVNSVWKAVELAMACVSKSPSRRPTMDYVVMELKGCLSLEIPHYEMTSKDSIDTRPLNSTSGSGPLAR